MSIPKHIYRHEILPFLDDLPHNLIKCHMCHQWLPKSLFRGGCEICEDLNCLFCQCTLSCDCAYQKLCKIKIPDKRK